MKDLCSIEIMSQPCKQADNLVVTRLSHPCCLDSCHLPVTTMLTTLLQPCCNLRTVSIVGLWQPCYNLASFPGSPLASTKNRQGGGEPGTDSHVISQHDDVTAIITKIVMQLCSHMMGRFKQLCYFYWNKWAVTASVRLCHGSNSSDGEEVSST